MIGRGHQGIQGIYASLPPHSEIQTDILQTIQLANKPLATVVSHIIVRPAEVSNGVGILDNHQLLHRRSPALCVRPASCRSTRRYGGQP